MRSILTILCLVLIGHCAFAQGRLQIQADLGVSFPVGTFGKTDPTAMQSGAFAVEIVNRGFDKSKAGFATAGYKTGINIGYTLFKRFTLLANYQYATNGVNEKALAETVQGLWQGDFNERVSHNKYETNSFLFGARYEIPVFMDEQLSFHLMAGPSTMRYPGYTISYPDFNFVYTQREEFIIQKKYDDPTATMLAFGLGYTRPITEIFFAGIQLEYTTANFNYEMINGSAPGGSDFFYFEDTVVYRTINFGFVIGAKPF